MYTGDFVVMGAFRECINSPRRGARDAAAGAKVLVTAFGTAR
jgi:hypothetical protein